MIKPSSWKRSFLDHPKATGIHTAVDLIAIRNLTSSFADEGPTPSVFRMSREFDTMILSIGSNKQVQIFHHLDLLGDRHSPTFKAVGFCSFGSIAPALEINHIRDFVDVSLRVPNWADLTSLDSPGAFQSLLLESQEEEDTRITALIQAGSTEDDANATRASRFSNSNLVALPLGLASVIFESPDREPSSIGYRLLKHMKSLDAEHEGEVENCASFESHCKYIIRFCWLATHDLIPTIPYILSEDEKVLEWSDRIHCALLLPPSIAANNSSQAIRPGENAALEKVAFSISSLQDHLSAKTSAKEKDDADKIDGTGGFKKRFGPHLQQLVLNASAEMNPETQDYDTSATEPVGTLDRFLSQSSIGGAKTFFRGHLKANPYLDFNPSQALITSMYTGNLTWDDSSTPVNFSIFFHGRSSVSSSGTSSSYTDQALYLKEHLGNGISESEVKQILKQDRHFPKDASEALDMIQNFLASTCFLFGEKSSICTNLAQCTSHILRNKPNYDSLQKNDASFLTQYLYSIDLAVQTHLASCLMETTRSSVNDDCLDFRVNQANVIRRQFSLVLPTCLRVSASVTPEKEDHGIVAGNGKIPGKDIGAHKRIFDELYQDFLNKGGLQPGGGNPNGGKNKVKNNRPNPSWTIKEGEHFGNVFHKNISTCPKQGSKYVCLKFWIRGECTKTCKFVHADLNQETRGKVDKWVKECRANAPTGDAQHFR
jgi:hypothetical protein